jgi:membrane protein YqaA with SNARE-associated domain
MSFDYIIDSASYLMMFIVSFVSATIFPLGSEALFIYMDSGDTYDTFILLLVATFGNTLGAIVNYYLGLRGASYILDKGYIRGKALQNATSIFNRFGIFALLLSWMPLLGDPITFVAGILRYNFYLFVVIIAFAKFARYAILVGIF